MEATLEAVKRSDKGKNEARRHRAAGRLPAVVYGTAKDGKAPVGVPVTVDPKGLLRILHSDSGVNTLITLKLDGGSTQVLVKEYQRDPITQALLHADFYQLAMDKAIVVTVPVLIKGESKGVKVQGGLLEIVTRSVEIECLPDEIPEEFIVDVTELLIGQTIRAQDVPMLGSMTLLSPGDAVISHVVSLKAEAAPAEDAAKAAEPEVIKKGKKEEAGATPAAGADKDKKKK